MIAGKTIREIAPALAIIATIIGGTWVILEEINETRVELHKEISESHVELQKQISESRVEFHKESGKVRVEIREENTKTREEVGGLRGDFGNLGSKFDEFKDSHEREHDLFYGQGGQ